MTAAQTMSDARLPLAFDDPRDQGDVVLFVHGFSHNRVVWDGVIEALDSGFRPIAVDLRGHGESEWSTEGAYGLDDYAGDLVGFLSHTEGPIHVVGHSLGGNAATLFAAAHAEQIRSLTLVDTGPALRLEAAMHIVGEVDSGFRALDSVAEYRRQLTMLHPLGAPELLDQLAVRSLVERLDGRFELALDPGVSSGDVSNFDFEADEQRLWAALEKVDAPVFVARGAMSSLLTEAVAQRVVDGGVTGSQLEVFPRAGHAVMIDAAEDLGRSLNQFLNACANA